jgi:integrase
LPASPATTFEAFKSKLLRSKLSRRSVQKLMVMLYGILDVAYKRRWIEANPAKDADRIQIKPSGDFRVLDPNEVALLIAKAADEQDAALYMVAAFTGLRLSELLALRWSDIDFANRILHVRRATVRGREKAPKSGKVRSLPLSAKAAVALDGLSKRQHFTGEDDRVFVNATGDVVGQDLLRRRFSKALKDAKLKPMRLHDLRHSFGTIAVRIYPLTDVQAYMGRADIQTTMLYVHHTPQHDAADKFDSYLATSEELATSGLPTGEFASQQEPSHAP